MRASSNGSRSPRVADTSSAASARSKGARKFSSKRPRQRSAGASSPGDSGGDLLDRPGEKLLRVPDPAETDFDLDQVVHRRDVELPVAGRLETLVDPRELLACLVEPPEREVQPPERPFGALPVEVQTRLLGDLDRPARMRAARSLVAGRCVDLREHRQGGAFGRPLAELGRRIHRLACGRIRLLPPAFVQLRLCNQTQGLRDEPQRSVGPCRFQRPVAQLHGGRMPSGAERRTPHPPEHGR